MEKAVLIIVDTDMTDAELGDTVAGLVGDMQDRTSDGSGSVPAVVMAGKPGHRFADRIDVLAFQQKFNVPMAHEPSWLPGHLFEFRLKFLKEELLEFEVAYLQGDMHGTADALVDLAYVLHGTALMMGLPWPMLWDEVQKKNMQKERAKHAGESKRGSSFDVVKPAGWTAPDHTAALGNGPWPTLKVED